MKTNILLSARAGKFAIAAFNVNTYDEMVAIAGTAAGLGTPVMLMASMNSAKFFGPSIFVKLTRALAEKYPVPIFAHLDHCTEPELILECARAGFYSVMYDGSHEPYGRNMSVTANLSKKCHDEGVFLEGELGVIAGDEGPVKSKYSEFTDPAYVHDFVAGTGLDSLAVSIGNRHGFYKGEPHLEFGLLEEINRVCPVPLVLHGGTGIPARDMERAIHMGVCKINVGTEIRATYVKALQDYVSEKGTKADVRDFVTYLMDKIGDTASKYIQSFGCNECSPSAP